MHYFGGLAEFVSRPTTLTYSYLSQWMTGSSSFGRAMDLLGLPHEKNTRPLLILIDGELAVDLAAESSVLYDKTLFSYRSSPNPHATPELRFVPERLLHPGNSMHTVKSVLVQSNWIAKPEGLVRTCTSWIDALPETYKQSASEELSTFIELHVLPAVLAVGFAAEFISQYLYRQNGPEIAETISTLAKPGDWFFRSVTDMASVQNGSMTFDEFIHTYGIRADNDYELTCPRWKEMPDEIQKRITGYTAPTERPASPAADRTPLIDCAAALTVLRSRAKRKMLIAVDALRTTLLSEKKIGDSPVTLPQNSGSGPVISQKTSGTGRPVSRGEVSGATFRIRSTADKIPEKAIGIFPDASPVYSILYTKCIGLIFLRGGTTSHGAIVAREYGIPALIDPEAGDIPDGTRVHINGGSGTWNTQL